MKVNSIRAVRNAWLAAVALAVLPALALAQSAGGSGSGDGATHGQRGTAKTQQDFNRKFQALSDSLKLSEEQSPKARAVFEAEELKVREIKTKFKGTPDTPENRAELKKELDELRADTHKQLEPILTPAQMGKMQKIHDDEMKKMKEKEKDKGAKSEKEDKDDDQGDKKADDPHKA